MTGWAEEGWSGDRGRDEVVLGLQHWDILAGLAGGKNHPEKGIGSQHMGRPGTEA